MLLVCVFRFFLKIIKSSTLASDVVLPMRKKKGKTQDKQHIVVTSHTNTPGSESKLKEGKGHGVRFTWEFSS